MSEPSQKVYACEEVRRVIRLHQDLFTEQFRRLSIREQLELQGQRIVDAHKTLMALSPANRDTFSGLVEFLEAEGDQRSNDQG